jgi:hypothetical protein
MEIKDFSKLTKHSVSQEGRFLEALDFDYVKIDERSFEDLLRFVYGFSKLIKFYNLENEPEGDWSDFINDETVILSSIKQIIPSEIEARFRIYAEKATIFNRPQKKIFYLQKCFNEIYQLAQMFDSWFMKFKHIEMFANIQLRARDEILNAINTKLGASLIQLKALEQKVQKIWTDQPYQMLDYSKFNISWELHKTSKQEINLEGETESEKVQYLIFDLEKIFQSFYESLVFLKSQSDNYLTQSLKNDSHYPEVALLISFLKLFKNSQDHINDLSRRYLEFYYRTVLQEDFKPPVFDQVYLSFDTNDNATHAWIKDKTPFIGGEYPNGENILYAVEKDLLINQAQIARLYTMFLESSTLSIRGRNKKLITNTLSSELSIKDILPNPEKQEKKSYAIFGEKQSDKSMYEHTMQNAEIGFAVASPSFFLSEGDREISLTFVFETESYQNLAQYLQDIQFLTDDSLQEVFVKSFLEAFYLEITMPKGWHSIKKYVITQQRYPENSEGFNALNIRFDINSNEPSWSSYNNTIHQGTYETPFPILKVLLNSNSYIYPYSLMQDLELQQIMIDTHSKEFKGIGLYSDIGLLDATNPFMPFGAIPHVGSYLVIGSHEIFQKSLTDLAVNIEWFNLPRNSSGFLDYYEDYDAEIDNTSFEVKLSILDGGRWKPSQTRDQQSFKLFRTQNNGFNGNVSQDTIRPNASLSPYTQFKNIDIIKLQLPHNYSEVQKKTPYSNLAQRGFIKIELDGPGVAFGHSIYPSVLSEIVTQNAKSGIFDSARRGFAKKQPKPLPNQPYTPQIKSISIDYSSSSVISLTGNAPQDPAHQRGHFFHIYPFGDNLVYPNQIYAQTRILPDFHYQGALLIGLKNLNPPEIITLLFEMSKGFSNSSEERPPLIEWSYLVNDQWVTLSESKILLDETLGFVKTGIIEIELPREIKKGNTILDRELFWLRIAALQNVENASQLSGLCTQVMKATLINLDEEGTHLLNPLPAFTITRSVNNLPGIQNTIQPLDSFRGRPQENSKEFYTRLSERLRHKQRAITAWDYERLILEKFPHIQKATCLSNMSSTQIHQSGSVLIVVTPYLEDKKIINPQVSREQLYEIKTYIQHYISPFVKLEVRNPAYERVKIICAVQLSTGYNYGLYLQKLSEDINRYLKQGMLQSGKTIELGGKINTSDILSFMRTLEYIDFITKFSMVQTAQDFQGNFMLLDTAREGDSKSFLQATKPWSALIPAGNHQITLLDGRDEINSTQAGISDLGLGNEFIVEH